MRKLTTVLFIATLAFAGLARAEFDGAVAQSNYVAAVDKQAYLDSVTLDEPAAVRFVNNRKGQLAVKEKDFDAAIRFFRASFDAGDETALPRLIKFSRLAGDVRGALAFEPQVESLAGNMARAWSYYELAICQPKEQVNAYLLKATQSGRIAVSIKNINLVENILKSYRFLDATPKQAIEFLDAADLMLEDTAETAAITGKIIDMKNEQKRREQ